MAGSNKVGIGSIKGGSDSTPSGFIDSSPILCGRVYDSVLDGSEKQSQKVGVTTGTTGAISFRFLRNGDTDETTPLQVAYCLSPSKRVFPIKNEIVKIVVASTPGATSASGNNLITYYYTEIVDNWNSPEHNSVPDGSFDENGEPVTGSNFKETGKIARLKHVPGDIIEEGRFGNSVRIGSSNKTANAPWRGLDGDPVYIIRNGQNPNLPKNTTLTYEDINQDGGSLYFLSSQAIDFIPANLNFDSYGQDISVPEKHNIVLAKSVDEVPVSVSPTTLDEVVLQNTSPQVTGSLATPKQNIVEDEIGFLPDKEEPVFYQELESVLVGTTQLNMNLNTKPEYIVKDSTVKEGSTERLSSSYIKPYIKGEFSRLPFKNFLSTPRSITDFVKTLDSLKKEQLISVNIARSLLAIAINEQSGTRGFNNNFFGIHSDIGAFRRSGRFSNSNPDHQVLAREGATGKMRAYLGFTDFRTALLYIADVLYAKGFGNIPYGDEEDEAFARMYINKWWASANTNVDTSTFNFKKDGYVKAKNLIV